MNDHITIGELAAQTRVTPKTIRYYETLGLLLPTERGKNRYRYYHQSHVHQLRFIRRAQRLGLSLNEIGQLMELARQAQCNDLRIRLDQIFLTRIREYELKIAALQTFRQQLQPEDGSCTCQAFVPDCDCLPAPAQG